MEDRCVACGAIIPEGRQVCKNCEIRYGVIKENQEEPRYFGVDKEYMLSEKGNGK